MDIKEFLSPADAQVDVTVSDKAELLQELADRAANSLSLPSDRILNELLKREKLGSTGTGGGIAIRVRQGHSGLARRRTPWRRDSSHPAVALPSRASPCDRAPPAPSGCKRG